jgi:hypothetical protein
MRGTVCCSRHAARPNLGATFRHSTASGDITMLQTIAIILIVLWLLGMVSAYTMGGFIHILLVIAVIVVLLRVIQGRSL